MIHNSYIIDTLGQDIFALERELEVAQAETDAVIAQLCGTRASWGIQP